MLIHSLNSLKPPMNKCDDGWMDLPSFSVLNITEYMVYFCPQNLSKLYSSHRKDNFQ